MRRTATAFAVLATAGVAVHLGSALAGRSGDAAVEDWLYGALFAATSASCAWRAVRSRGERLPWALASVGVAVWLAAEVVYRATESDPSAAYPPATRALLLLSFTLAAITIALLARRRVREVEPRLLLDGLIGGLAVAAVAAIPLFGGETTAASQTAPPALFLLADLAILAFVVVVTGLTGWRPGPGWSLIAGGIMLNTAGNCALVIESANGSFERGGPVDSLFLASAVTLGVAAFFSMEPSVVAQTDRRRLFWPAAFALVAVGVLVAAGLTDTSAVAVALGAATLVVLVARTLLAFGDNARLLARAQHEALTDALTGLGNRRQLTRDFEALERSGDRWPDRTLVLFDLDGFKAYNDAFGHPAGDTLLKGLAARLGRATAPHPAYRVGGDEFCVLIAADRLRAESVLAAGESALTEQSEAFSITASHGAVSMPAEARSSELALQLADRRMYAHKERRLNSPSEQTQAALRALLDERSPAATARHRELSDLAYLLADRQGLGQPDIDHLVRAAELHDIGRAALPAGLVPSSPEDPLVAQQTLIAERVLTAAPALAPVARIVRSLHERYDGSGHPDGLAGQEIPSAARILGAALAFTERLGSERRPRPEALEWLTGESGTRLDPFVADTLRELARELRLTELDLEARRAALAEQAARRRRGVRPYQPALDTGRASART